MPRKKIKIKDLSIGCFLFILILGALIGCLVYSSLPYLAHLYPFNKISWLNSRKDGVTIINKTEKIVVTENQALAEVVSQVSQTVVGVKTIGAKGTVLTEGSGFILTSDGLIVTAVSMIPPGQRGILVIRDNNEIPASLERFSLKDGLAILNIEASNLPVVRLRDSSELRLGETVFLFGVNIQKEVPEKFINKGLISSISSEGFKTNIQKESPLANGSPLFNIKGEGIGLNLVDRYGNLTTIQTELIRQLLR